MLRPCLKPKKPRGNKSHPHQKDSIKKNVHFTDISLMITFICEDSSVEKIILIFTDGETDGQTEFS